MTLWLFGDSFAGKDWEWAQDPNFPHYYAVLADKLRTDYKQYGLGGSSAEYTYDQFYKNKSEIKKNDIVLIALTTPSRRWFFHDRPRLTSFWGFSADVENSSLQEREAFEQYMLYLNHQLLFDLAMTNFLYALEFFAIQQKVKVIVMPCFPDVFELASKLDLEQVKIAKGNLWKINEDESTPDFRNDIALILNDGKPNHLTATNHKRLAEKILQTIKHDDPLDLTNGFVKGSYTKDSIKDANYRLSELGNTTNKISIKFK